MSVASSGSSAGDGRPESPYRDNVDMPDDYHRTPRSPRSPSPLAQQDDSYDDLTPPHRSTQSGSVWITPSQRSNSGSIATNAKTALEELYKRIYGQDSIRCLLTQAKGALQVAHAVQRASKSSELTLYEYCLGLDFWAFHVDSRRNLFYLKSDWHIQFDADNWILLPSFAVLEAVRDFIQTVISARRRSAQAEIPSFFTKWNLENKSKYTFIPLSSIMRDPFMRLKPVSSPAASQAVPQWDLHFYPYHTLPDLECHVAPPFVAINGGRKLAGVDLDAITLDYCQSSDSRPTLKGRLEVLREIWEILQSAKQDASKWEESKRGKRKRDEDDEDIERLTQSSQRTTRSKLRASQAPAPQKTANQQTSHRTSTAWKRKAHASLTGTTLTEYAVRHHNKRQKTSRFHNSVKRWAESIHG
ncbi:hypothetical protein JOM56_015390 [Amanita muscaria]